MKFVLLVYHGPTPALPGSDRWKALPEAEQKAIYAEYAELNKIDLYRFAADQVFQRRALHHLHSDEGTTLVIGDLVDDANVWMIESRGRSSFALEPRKRLRPPGEVFG